MRFGNTLAPTQSCEAAAMEINTTTTTIYSIPATDIPAHPANRDETVSIWRLPKIAWACAILFCINLMIATCITISPELDVNIYGAAAGDVVLANAKPSAFVEPAAKPKPVRQAMKLTPVVELLPEAAAVMSVEIPATYRQPAYFAGSATIEAAETVIN
jgi:hypothetical protein